MRRRLQYLRIRKVSELCFRMLVDPLTASGSFPRREYGRVDVRMLSLHGPVSRRIEPASVAKRATYRTMRANVQHGGGTPVVQKVMGWELLRTDAPSPSVFAHP